MNTSASKLPAAAGALGVFSMVRFCLLPWPRLPAHHPACHLPRCRIRPPAPGQPNWFILAVFSFATKLIAAHLAPSLQRVPLHYAQRIFVAALAEPSSLQRGSCSPRKWQCHAPGSLSCERHCMRGRELFRGAEGAGNYALAFVHRVMRNACVIAVRRWVPEYPVVRQSLPPFRFTSVRAGWPHRACQSGQRPTHQQGLLLRAFPGMASKFSVSLAPSALAVGEPVGR